MAVFRCKMCGGELEIQEGMSVCTCDYCGTKQTLPRLDDDKKANLYDRADHFRRNNDYDKAMGIYEQILNEDKTDAEAYWSLVLCRFGIEYVEDPATHKRVPTINRTQHTSIYADEDYKSALQYADSYQKQVYEEEAKAIDEIQKGILEIAEKEEPFDVFICYKETDANGRRTPDSVLANDLYHQLTEEGFKVFFSRITLEDKLGSAYEPYIFAALNSAKVMVALGTKPEYFNAVWVKNEWSRYLSLIKNGAKKTLIPAYRDMDPYDLPEAFSHLQAQDMSKLGFMQDLIRGIKKITAAETSKPADTVIVNNASGTANVNALIDRGFMALEDGEWDSADGFFEEALNQDARNAQCYLGKLMAELKVRTKEDLAGCSYPFDYRNNYNKIIRFGDVKLQQELTGYISQINRRNAEEEAERRRREEEARRAEEEARIVEEEKKQREQEEAERKEREETEQVNAIIAAFQREKEGKNEKSKEAVLQEKKEACSKLEGILDSYDETMARVENLRKQADENQGQLESARTKRKQLGLFAGKEKKQLDAQIAELSAGAEKIQAEINSMRKKLGGFSSKEDATREYEKQKQEMGALEEQLKNAGVGYTHEQIKTLIEENRRVRDKVCMLCPQITVTLDMEKGKSIFLGRYRQKNEKPEPVEWIVLAKEENRVQVVSKYALDCKPYHKYDYNIWKSCGLRSWLNENFLNKAFSREEQAMIQSIIADKDWEYSTYPEKGMTDQVFLLSVKEAQKYFSSNESRKCAPTSYAKAQGAGTSDNWKTADGEASCWWWLRSPGDYGSSCAACVTGGGSVSSNGYDVRDGHVGVRPALWINLES